MGFAHHRHLHHPYRLGELYQSCYGALTGKSKRSGNQKSCWQHEETTDESVHDRIIVANVFSLLLAFVLVFTLQSAFNRLVQHELSLSYLFQKGLSGYTIAIGLMLLLITGILASGFYPAFVLSSFKPIQVLKGNYSTSKRGIVLRKALVVAQFGITVALMIGSFVVYRQINFMNRTALGFNMDQLMIIKPPVLTEWDSTFINKTNQFQRRTEAVNACKRSGYIVECSWR